MKVFILSHDVLDALKVNIEYNMDKYKEDSNQWIEKQLGHSPFIEFSKSVGEFKLDPKVKEVENTKTLYTAMKDITDSEATDERLWAGISHSICWDFMRENLHFNMENNSRVKLNSNTIINRYFYNTKINGRKRSIYINTLAKMWWLGRLCYNDESKGDPFKYLELFETAFSHKLVNMFSSNILGNSDIRFAFFDAGMYIKSLGLQIKGDTMAPMLIYLNEIGGRIILDVLDKDEIYGLLVDYVDNNLEEIANR